MGCKLKKQTLPQSPTCVSINLFALAITTLTIVAIRQYGGNLSTLQAVIICLLSLAGSIVLLEFVFLRTFLNPSTGLDFSLKRPWNFKRIFIKLLGFYVTLILVALVYWLFPEYHGRFYIHYWGYLRIIVPILSLGAIPYFVLVDHFMKEPRDGYWHLGMFVLCKWSKINRYILGQHLLGWLVKLFFLPLMYTYLVSRVQYFRTFSYSNIFNSFNAFYDFVYSCIFGIDLIFVTAGYTLSLRIFDSHMRSVEPTLLGWFVALECYEPFWSFSSGTYLKYMNGYYWDNWFSGHPFLIIFWGSAILFLLTVYVYATIPFGIRFSNLTNRSILTNGPYRWTKHPAYVSKNLSWWFISIPFLPQAGLSESLRLSLLLLCVNVIYFLRARTEERHLSKDPVYIEYATAMNERSIFAFIGKIIPVLKFKPYQLFNSNENNFIGKRLLNTTR
jgi:protein-S-isoprenylcysteine O-methyltransferase Ste14